MPARHAGVLQDADDAGRAFVAGLLQPVPRRRRLVVGVPVTCVGRVCGVSDSSAPRRHDEAYIERADDLEQLLAERAPAHVRLDAAHQDQVEVRRPVGGTPRTGWSARRSAGSPRRPATPSAG